MSKKSTATGLIDHISDSAVYNGLMGYTVEMYERRDYPTIEVKLQKNIDISYIDGRCFYQEIVKYLFGSIESSPLVKDITSELSNKIEQLTKENDTLKTEVASLKPYKTYYDLHMDLTHGKK